VEFRYKAGDAPRPGPATGFDPPGGARVFFWFVMRIGLLYLT
jgi:hypothetical protein